jgi:hypothetical protein
VHPILKITLGIAAFVSLLAAGSATAVTRSRHMADQGGSRRFRLPIEHPTIASNVRQRAAGIRNGGSTNTFVICQFASNGGNNFFFANLYVYSFDGVDHSVACTGMSGGILATAAYSTQQIATGTGAPAYGVIEWRPQSFGQASAESTPLDDPGFR